MLLFLAGLLLALSAAEVILRTWFPLMIVGTTDSFRYDETTGYTLKANLELRKATDYQQEIVTNALGTANFGAEFSAFDQLAIAVGDSYTQGLGVPADASYPDFLEQLINGSGSTYAPRVGVINLGVAGFGGEQAILRLQEFLGTTPAKAPTFILYLGAMNDALDDRDFANGRHHQHLVDGSQHWGKALGFLQWLARLELGKRAKLTLDRIRFPTAPVAISPAQLAELRSHYVSVAEQQVGVLDKLLDLAQHNHAQLIVSWAQSHGVAFAD